MLNVLVTGASAGFGQAISKHFVQQGHRVFGVGRRNEKLEILRDELGELFIPLVLDVRDECLVQKTLEEKVFSRVSTLDILVNNAGLALGINTVQNSSFEDWKTMVDTNIMGVLNFTHAVLPKMLKSQKGHIIHLGSIAGEFPYPGGNVYGATKAFLHQFSLNMRADLLGTPIRVTCIEPGLCSDTEFSTVRFKGDENKAKAVYEGVQAIRPEDVAETIFWVATRPAHVNINVISMMPVQQAFSALAIHRDKML